MKKVVFGSVLFIGGVLGIIGTIIANVLLKMIGTGYPPGSAMSFYGNDGFLFMVFILVALAGFIIGLVGVVTKEK